MGEKWSFVGKKQAECDPGDRADDDPGWRWDYVALDPEARLVLAVVPGRRTAADCRALVAEARRRTGGRVPRLVTTDEYAPYKFALAKAYGRRTVPLTVLPRRPGQPRVTRRVVPPGLTYAVLHECRERGRVVRATTRAVFDTAVAAALVASTASTAVNTSFVERKKGTDRHMNARQGRKTYRFSKAIGPDDAATYYTMYGYDFWRPVRTPSENSRQSPRTPAMAAGLADHVWTIREWVTFPAVQLSWTTRQLRRRAKIFRTVLRPTDHICKF